MEAHYVDRSLKHKNIVELLGYRKEKLDIILGLRNPFLVFDSYRACRMYSLNQD